MGSGQTPVGWGFVGGRLTQPLFADRDRSCGMYTPTLRNYAVRLLKKRIYSHPLSRFQEWYKSHNKAT